jgi:type I restriction enzyme, S subunit
MTWSDARLGDFVRIEHGFAFKGEHFKEAGKHVVLTPGHFHEQGGFRARPGKDRFYAAPYPERYLLSAGDLIVAMTEQGEGLLGSAALIPEDDKYLHNQRIGLVKKKSRDADHRFFYYLFNTDYVREQIRNSSSGAKVRHTSPERMYAAKVRVPPKATQTRIAAILSAYDDLIANNQRRIALLESMAEEIYREWFVRMRFPGAEQTDFSKGVPKAWAPLKLSTYCDIVKGKSYAAEDLTEDDSAMPFVTLKSFNRGGGYRADGLKFYKGEYKERQVVKQGDLIMAVTDMTQDRVVVGQSARIPNIGDRGGVISLDVMRLVPIQAEPTFLYLFLRFSGFASYIKEFANGANVLHLKPDLVGRQEVVLPPRDLQEKLSKLAEPMLREAEHLSEISEKLTQTRDALLPRLISGKLKVDHLDIRLPPSMQDKVTTRRTGATSPRFVHCVCCV